MLGGGRQERYIPRGSDGSQNADLHLLANDRNLKSVSTAEGSLVESAMRCIRCG